MSLLTSFQSQFFDRFNRNLQQRAISSHDDSTTTSVSAAAAGAITETVAIVAAAMVQCSSRYTTDAATATLGVVSTKASADESNTSPVDTQALPVGNTPLSMVTSPNVLTHPYALYPFVPSTSLGHVSLQQYMRSHCSTSLSHLSRMSAMQRGEFVSDLRALALDALSKQQEESKEEGHPYSELLLDVGTPEVGQPLGGSRRDDEDVVVPFSVFLDCTKRHLHLNESACLRLQDVDYYADGFKLLMLYAKLRVLRHGDRRSKASLQIQSFSHSFLTADICHLLSPQNDAQRKDAEALVTVALVGEWLLHDSDTTAGSASYDDDVEGNRIGFLYGVADESPLTVASETTQQTKRPQKRKRSYVVSDSSDDESSTSSSASSSDDVGTVSDDGGVGLTLRHASLSGVSLSLFVRENTATDTSAAVAAGGPAQYVPLKGYDDIGGVGSLSWTLSGVGSKPLSRRVP